MSKKESAGRLIPFYNMMCSRKSIHRLWILFVDIRFASREPKQRTGPSSCALYISALSSLGNTAVLRRYDWERWSVRPDRFPKEKRFNSVQPVCELLPQALSLHIIDVLIAVGGVNDLGTGINKGINLFAFQRLYRSFHCLIAHVVAELGDIHAERTVLDSGDSGGIAVKAAHDGIGIRLLSTNAEKLHFCNKKCSFHGGDREI